VSFKERREVAVKGLPGSEDKHTPERGQAEGMDLKYCKGNFL
jgi:hypothetical protein